MINTLINFKKKDKISTKELVDRGFAPKNNIVDILFVYPSDNTAKRYGKDEDMGEVGGNLIPLGIACLSAYVREKGWGVGVLDCPALGIDSEEVYEIIKEKDPQIIAFSTTTYSLAKAVEMAKYIREKFPKKLTLLGGAHANVAGEDTANRYNFFDIIAYGLDGEYIILDVVSKYSEVDYDRNKFINNIDLLKSINGIIFKYKNKVIKNTPPKPVDLDELPLPARDLFPIERYIPLPNQYKRLPLTNMVVIRGCPYFCSFCDQAGTGARRRSPENTVAEIKHCVEKYGVREISFWDDTMSYHRKWMKEFLERLIKEDLGVIWSCYAAVNTVDKEMLQLMKKAGCWNIFFGFETAVEELAKNMLTNRKNRDFERMKQVADWAKGAGIEIRGAFMVGLPGETPELARQTIQNAIDIDPDYAQFAIACPFPGTKLAEEISQGKWGKFITQDFEEYHSFSVTWLPNGYKNVKELEDMLRYAYRKFYMRPSYIIKRILKIRSFEDILKYYRGGRALIKSWI